jgi:hypothetical protein
MGAGLESFLAEACRLGWKGRSREIPGDLAGRDDASPIGPCPGFLSGSSNPLTMGVLQGIGRAINSVDPQGDLNANPSERVQIGEDLVMMADDILREEMKRRRVAAGEPEGLDRG